MSYVITAKNSNTTKWYVNTVREAISIITWVGCHFHKQTIIAMRDGNEKFTVHSLMYYDDNKLSMSVEYNLQYIDKTPNDFVTTPGQWALGDAKRWVAYEAGRERMYAKSTYFEMLGALAYFDDHAPKQILTAFRTGKKATAVSISFLESGEQDHQDYYIILGE